MSCPDGEDKASGCDGVGGACGTAITIAAVAIQNRSDTVGGASGTATVVVTGHDQCISSDGGGASGTAPVGAVAANRRAKPSIGSQSNGTGHGPNGIDRRVLKKKDPIGRSGRYRFSHTKVILRKCAPDEEMYRYRYRSRITVPHREVRFDTERRALAVCDANALSEGCALMSAKELAD